jgi:hypothetical protein
MKRFTFERPYKSGTDEKEIWVCDQHYPGYLESAFFQKMVGEYSQIIITNSLAYTPKACCDCPPPASVQEEKCPVEPTLSES